MNKSRKRERERFSLRDRCLNKNVVSGEEEVRRAMKTKVKK